MYPIDRARMPDGQHMVVAQQQQQVPGMPDAQQMVVAQQQQQMPGLPGIPDGQHMMVAQQQAPLSAAAAAMAVAGKKAESKVFGAVAQRAVAASTACGGGERPVGEQAGRSGAPCLSG